VGKQIRSVSVQANGKILVVGDFDSWGGFDRRGIVRLNEDGTVDGSFTPGAGAEHSLPGSAALFGSAQQAMPLPDGKILLRGDFSHYNGVVITGQRFVGASALPVLIQLNADGTRDFSFSQLAGASVNDFTLAADGTIMINGFVAADSDGCLSLFRLTASTFSPVWQRYMSVGNITSLSYSPDARFIALGTQDGRIVVVDGDHPEKKSEVTSGLRWLNISWLGTFQNAEGGGGSMLLANSRFGARSLDLHQSN
jgi:WD40 repeat protein